MNYGICDQAVVPVRYQPGERNEMVNQLLFGDLVVIKGTVKGWLLIETFDDQYEGWIDKKQLSILSNEEFNELILEERFYALDLARMVVGQPSNKSMIIPRGAQLTGYANNSFILKNDRFDYDGKVIKADFRKALDNIETIASSYLGAPYQWGGRSPLGIDCSGFVQVVFKLCGYPLPRDSSEQVNIGSNVSFVNESRVGDLAFFGNDEGEIVHVGIILDDQKIIHASGKVRIDKIDHQGIFNLDTNQYSHNLRVIKRILE